MSLARLLLLATGIGVAAGMAQVLTHVAWPPLAALVVGAAFLGFVAPRHAWSLGLLLGLIVSTVGGTAGSSGWSGPVSFGVLGPFGATLPALAGAYVGHMAAALAIRLRRGTRTLAT